MNNRRTKIKRYYDVLNLLSQDKGTLKTHILYKANLSTQCLELITKDLLLNKIIIFQNKRYYLTKEGVHLTNSIKKIFDVINNLNNVYGMQF